MIALFTVSDSLREMRRTTAGSKNHRNPQWRPLGPTRLPLAHMEVLVKTVEND